MCSHANGGKVQNDAFPIPIYEFYFNFFKEGEIVIGRALELGHLPSNTGIYAISNSTTLAPTKMPQAHVYFYFHDLI